MELRRFDRYFSIHKNNVIKLVGADTRGRLNQSSVNRAERANNF